MPFRLTRLVRQLATAFVAVAFVVVAFGSVLSVAHATGSGSFGPTFTNANAQDDTDLVQDYASAPTHCDAVVDQAGLDSPNNKADGVAKSPCCNGYCSPTYSLPGHSMEALALNGNDDFPIRVQVLTSVEHTSLKRPPRIAPGMFARA